MDPLHAILLVYAVGTTALAMWYVRKAERGAVAQGRLTGAIRRHRLRTEDWDVERADRELWAVVDDDVAAEDQAEPWRASLLPEDLDDSDAEWRRSL